MKNCKLNCAKITNEIILYARNCCRGFAERDVNGKSLWLSMFVRSSIPKLSDTQIWGNYVRENVRSGRRSWSCTYCKCNPNSPPDHTVDDPNHRFKKTKKRSKFAACPDFESGVTFKNKTIVDWREKKQVLHLLCSGDRRKRTTSPQARFQCYF